MRVLAVVAALAVVLVGTTTRADAAAVPGCQAPSVMATDALLCGVSFSPKSLIPLPGIPGISDIIGIDPLEPVKDAVGAVAGEIGGSIFEGMTGWVGDGASWVMEKVFDGITTATEVDLSAEWFTEHLRIMAAIGAALLLPLLCIAAVSSLARQEWGPLMRGFFLFMPVALLSTGVIVFVVQGALTLTDRLSEAVLSTGRSDVSDMGELMGGVFVLSGGGIGPLFVVFVMGLVACIVGLLLMLELIGRAAAIYLAVLFLPLVLATSVAPGAIQLVRRLGALIASLVVSKFVIAAVLSLGASALGALGTGKDPSLSGALVGLALLIMAAFSPFALLRMLPLAREAAGAQGHLRRGATGAAGFVGGVAAATIIRGRMSARGAGAGPPLLGGGGGGDSLPPRAPFPRTAPRLPADVGVGGDSTPGQSPVPSGPMGGGSGGGIPEHPGVPRLPHDLSSSWPQSEEQTRDAPPPPTPTAPFEPTPAGTPPTGQVPPTHAGSQVTRISPQPQTPPPAAPKAPLPQIPPVRPPRRDDDDAA